MGEYLKKKIVLCQDYAQGLQKLSRQFIPLGDDELGLKDLVEATDTIVEAHLELVEHVQRSVLAALRIANKDHERARREKLVELKYIRSNWRQTLNNFEKKKRSKDQEVKQAEEARRSFERANNDWNVTKAHVEKLREDYATKARRTLVAKEEYIQAVQAIQEEQRQVYGIYLPEVFEQLQKIEETRVAKVQLNLLEFGRLMFHAVSNESKKYQEMLSKWEVVNPSAVIRNFIDQTKDDKPFEYPEEFSLDECASVESLGLSKGIRGIPPSPMVDPEEARQRADNIAKELLSLEKERDGLKTIYQLYEQQPVLADEKTKDEINRQINELVARIASLQYEQCTIRENLIDSDSCQQLSGRSSPSQRRSPRQSNSSSVAWQECEESEAISDISKEDTMKSNANEVGSPILSTLNTLQDRVTKGKKCTRIAITLFDHEVKNDSNGPLFLGFKAEQRLTIISEEGDWFHAQDEGGSIGYVPANYVRMLVKD